MHKTGALDAQNLAEVKSSQKVSEVLQKTKPSLKHGGQSGCTKRPVWMHKTTSLDAQEKSRRPVWMHKTTSLDAQKNGFWVLGGGGGGGGGVFFIKKLFLFHYI
tara:strand:+ start:142 stop:453 length:312 start_codon:yes stop_codon:yes gene_type:complete